MNMSFAPLAAGLALASSAAAQEAPKGAPSPGEIVAAAPAADWVAIAPADLLVMTLAPGRDGKARQVAIQLMSAPFSQGWVGNIRKLATAQWWDGLAITRAQDNYVVQWGDPDGEDKVKAKALPLGLASVHKNEYTCSTNWRHLPNDVGNDNYELDPAVSRVEDRDQYSAFTAYIEGWPVAGIELGRSKDALIYERPLSRRKNRPVEAWPVHCYGMVGVGRGYSPDTGSGAELYTVIGHAPRHLDRNIALVGRVVEGIEHLSSLPRGTGPLGFYEQVEQRVPIVSIRLASEVPEAEQPKFQYLSTESDSFARYADARANRRDPFFIVPAGGADICNIPVPVRRVVAR